MSRIGIELRRLRAEHQQLHAMSDVILGLIASSSVADDSRLQPYWQEFRALLIRHLKCEDWVLYPRLQSSTDKQLSALADGLFREVGALFAQLERFELLWTQEARAGDWTAYVRDMRSILALVDHRSVQEERQLFPMAAQFGGYMASHAIPTPKEQTRRSASGIALGVDLMPSLA